MNNWLGLEGKVVIVTGGASGIGFCMIGVAALAAGFMLRSKEEDEEY